jgi:hypothetical protein
MLIYRRALSPADLIEVECRPDGTFTLETLQGLVGGYIEDVTRAARSIPDDVVVLADEEGALKAGKPVVHVMGRWPLYGPAILVRQRGADLVGLTDEQIRQATAPMDVSR